MVHHGCHRAKGAADACVPASVPEHGQPAVGGAEKRGGQDHQQRAAAKGCGRVLLPVCCVPPVFSSNAVGPLL